MTLGAIILNANDSYSNQNQIVGEKYEKIQHKSSKFNISTTKDAPKEFVDDIKALDNIKYLSLKTDYKYEVALAYESGDYTYVDSTNNIDDAIKIANNKRSDVDENIIPVVLNNDGLVIYATEGIGRIVKIVGGVPDNSKQYTASLYKNENDSEKNTYASINHGFVDDVPIIKDNGTRVKIEIAGFTGWIDKQDKEGINIVQVPANQIKNLSYYYKTSNGSLNHYISYDVQDENKGNTRTIGVAPDFMQVNKKYYSYDGNYFYDNVDSLILDLKNNNHNNAVNNNPFYNYYSYLPGRSKTYYLVRELDSYINNNTPENSVIRGKASAIVKAQNKYGVNADIILGIAMNESNKGTSDIAINKNNIFGMNAIDSNTGQAIKFNSVEESIEYFAKEYMSNGYLNPKSWKYSGSNLGNKNLGMNVRYATDPYWGEKAADFMYQMDKYISPTDNLLGFNNYQIGIYTDINTVTDIDGNLLYNVFNNRNTEGQVGDPVILLSKVSSKYEIYPDRQVPMSIINPNPGCYNWDIKGYANASSVVAINSKNSNVPRVEETGWIYENGKWYFYYEDGSKHKEWLNLNGKWYYLNGNGQMVIGWNKIGGYWYFFDGIGEMLTGWTFIDSKWYYLKPSGEMTIGWELVNGKWYYLKPSGEMSAGWELVNGKWYYLKPSGEMSVGWELVNGKWYYLKPSGEMTIGWELVNGKWYYLKPSGEMSVGWELVNGKWYYLKLSGEMATNTIIDGWRISESGVATPL